MGHDVCCWPHRPRNSGALPPARKHGTPSPSGAGTPPARATCTTSNHSGRPWTGPANHRLAAETQRSPELPRRAGKASILRRWPCREIPARVDRSAAQRRANNHGTLPLPKIVLMESLPEWNASPRQHQRQLYARWCLRLSQLQDFVAATGQIPRWKRHASEHERILGVWLHTQTQARSEGSLPQWRQRALDTALPGWHSTM